MGPGCFYPGNVQEFPDDNRGRSGFNGAGMFLSRKYPHATFASPPSLASMGPGCFYPGNLDVLRITRFGALLQWGRDVSIPEMRWAGDTAPSPLRLQWGRDVSIPEIRIIGDTPLPVALLQWGRDVSIPEIWVRHGGRLATLTLQWGRDVSIPEIATHYSILFSRTYAPVRERLSILSPISAPGPSATPLTPAAPQLYRSASAPRSTSAAPPLAPDYRVVNTGYSAISPSNTRANSRAWISSNRR